MIINKIVLITGGSSGIGKAAVELFLKNKNKVIVIDKNSLKKKNKNLYFYNFDLEKTKLVKQLLKKISKKFNKIDVLILSAAICPMKDFLKIDEKIFDKVINTNQKSVFFFAQEVSKIMIKKKNKRKNSFFKFSQFYFWRKFTSSLLCY